MNDTETIEQDFKNKFENHFEKKAGSIKQNLESKAEAMNNKFKTKMGEARDKLEKRIEPTRDNFRNKMATFKGSLKKKVGTVKDTFRYEAGSVNGDLKNKVEIAKDNLKNEVAMAKDKVGNKAETARKSFQHKFVMLNENLKNKAGTAKFTFKDKFSAIRKKLEIPNQADKVEHNLRKETTKNDETEEETAKHSGTETEVLLFRRQPLAAAENRQVETELNKDCEGPTMMHCENHSRQTQNGTTRPPSSASFRIWIAAGILFLASILVLTVWGCCKLLRQQHYECNHCRCTSYFASDTSSPRFVNNTRTISNTDICN